MGDFFEFHDIRFWHYIAKLGTACLCGFIIGIEREYRGKAAGLRTYMLICMGACLFTIVSEFVAYQALERGIKTADPARIAAQIVTGIGFLGAGAIIRHRGGVSGLTSAAGIWGAAAIGLAVGAGMPLLALISAIGFVLTMNSFHFITRVLRIRRYVNFSLEVVLKKETRIFDIRKVLRDLKLEFGQESMEQILGESHYKVQVSFKGDLEQEITDKLSAIKGVKDVRLLNVIID